MPCALAHTRPLPFASRRHHAPVRTPAILRNRSTSAARVPRRRSPRRLAGARARALGYFTPDGAHGHLAAAGAGAAARPSELELARIWHAGRILAHQAGVRAAQDHADGDVERRGCETYPAVVQACLDNGWELDAHGYEQIPMHKLDDQRGGIEKAMDDIEGFSGKRPRGWFGPGLTQTYDTLDYLSEAGIEYIGDWVLDDEPVTLKTTHKPVVALPYNFEIHDIVLMALQHQPSDMMYRRALDHFDCLYAECAERRNSWRSPCIPTSRACRIGSSTSSAPMRTSSAVPASPAGTAREFLDWYLGQHEIEAVIRAQRSREGRARRDAARSRRCASRSRMRRYAALRLTLVSAILLSFSSAAFSSSRFCLSRRMASWWPSVFAQASACRSGRSRSAPPPARRRSARRRDLLVVDVAGDVLGLLDQAVDCRTSTPCGCLPSSLNTCSRRLTWPLVSSRWVLKPCASCCRSPSRSSRAAPSRSDFRRNRCPAACAGTGHPSCGCRRKTGPWLDPFLLRRYQRRARGKLRANAPITSPTFEAAVRPFRPSVALRRALRRAAEIAQDSIARARERRLLGCDIG